LCRKVPDGAFAWIVLAMLVMHLVFAFRYTVADRYAFFLPFYCLAAVVIGLGADAFLRRGRHKAWVVAVLGFALLPIPAYCAAPELARKVYKPLGARRQRPYRDEYTYFLRPWKTGYGGAQRFADEALGQVEDGAVIYADSTVVHTLLYVQQAQRKREDVKIVSEYYASDDAPVFDEHTIAELMRTSAVYVVSPMRSYCPEFVLDGYDTVKKGVLYQVVERSSDS
jgi:hypothetical protein